MDGEVYDDGVQQDSFSLLDDVIYPTRLFLLSYGWYLLAAAFVLHQIFTRIVRPRLQQQQQYAATGAQKKSDANNDPHADSVRAARDRQQAHYDKVAAEAEEARKIKEEEKRARLLEEMMKKSVVENALLDHKMGEARREKEKKKVEVEKDKGDIEESPADFLLRTIASAPIVIVSKSFCPYSRKAKAAFATYRLPREEVVYLELDELGEVRERAVQAELARLYDRERVPAVFVSGDFIGDHDSIVAHQREGILDVLVRDATEQWRKRQQ